MFWPGIGVNQRVNISYIYGPCSDLINIAMVWFNISLLRNWSLFCGAHFKTLRISWKTIMTFYLSIRLYSINDVLLYYKLVLNTIT